MIEVPSWRTMYNDRIEKQSTSLGEIILLYKLINFNVVVVIFFITNLSLVSDKKYNN